MTKVLFVALAIFSATVARAGAIPFKQNNDVASAALPGGAVGVLLLSLAAILVVIVVRKRLHLHAEEGAASHFRILETRRLGPRSLLAVVEFGGARYLIAQGEHGINCLARSPVEFPGVTPGEGLQ